MPKRALLKHRPWLLASVAAATAFYFLSNDPIGGIQLMLLKGLGVALLAIYVLRRHLSVDGGILAAVMALSAIGDMAIEVSFIAGGAAFFFAHIAAIALYLRHRRQHPTGSQKLAGAALFVFAPVISYLLTKDAGVTFYAVGLGTMAALAWLSRFPRYRVGVGAVLFVVSDWLIFYRMGQGGESVLADWLVWPLYYSGQFMIATGVVQSLRNDLPLDRD